MIAMTTVPPAGKWRKHALSFVEPTYDADGMRADNPDVTIKFSDLIALCYALHEAAGVLEVYANRAGDGPDDPTRVAIECFRGCALDFDPRPMAVDKEH